MRAGWYSQRLRVLIGPTTDGRTVLFVRPLRKEKVAMPDGAPPDTMTEVVMRIVPEMVGTRIAIGYQEIAADHVGQYLQVFLNAQPLGRPPMIYRFAFHDTLPERSGERQILLKKVDSGVASAAVRILDPNSVADMDPPPISGPLRELLRR